MTSSKRLRLSVKSDNDVPVSTPTLSASGAVLGNRNLTLHMLSFLTQRDWRCWFGVNRSTEKWITESAVLWASPGARVLDLNDCKSAIGKADAWWSFFLWPHRSHLGSSPRPIPAFDAMMRRVYQELHLKKKKASPSSSEGQEDDQKQQDKQDKDPKEVEDGMHQWWNTKLQEWYTSTMAPYEIKEFYGLGGVPDEATAFDAWRSYMSMLEEFQPEDPDCRLDVTIQLPDQLPPRHRMAATGTFMKLITHCRTLYFPRQPLYLMDRTDGQWRDLVWDLSRQAHGFQITVPSWKGNSMLWRLFEKYRWEKSVINGEPAGQCERHPHVFGRRVRIVTEGKEGKETKETKECKECKKGRESKEGHPSSFLGCDCCVLHCDICDQPYRRPGTSPLSAAHACASCFRSVCNKTECQAILQQEKLEHRQYGTIATLQCSTCRRLSLSPSEICAAAAASALSSSS